MKKRSFSLLLVLVMLVSMLPTTVLASTTPEIYVDTTGLGELKAGDSVAIPVAVRNNTTGLCMAYVQMTIPDVLTYVSIEEKTGGDSAVWTDGKVQWTYDGNYENDYTEDGTLFVMNFTVNEGAAGGEHTIGIELLGGISSNVGNATEDVEVTFAPGTITIAGETVEGLSFTNGAQSWTAENYSELQTIMTNGSGLTTPGSGYFFAGFFSGLEDDGTYITEENGYYILSAGAIGSGQTKSFANVTEWRPRYDTLTDETTGEYHALWLKNDINDQIVKSSMQVLNAGGIAVTVYANADDTALLDHAVTMLKADFAAVGGDGYVKLLTDLDTNAEVSADTANLDMNGHSITSSGAVLTLKYGSIESSYGKGKLEAADYMINLNVTKQVEVIRDVSIIGNLTIQNYATVGKLERCDITDVAQGHGLDLNMGSVISELSHCEITAFSCIYVAANGVFGNGTAKVLNIHDCKFIQDAAAYGYAFDFFMMSYQDNVPSAEIEFGANNTVSTTIVNEVLCPDVEQLTVRFTDPSGTFTSLGGDPFPVSDGITYVFPDGYELVQGSGTAAFQAKHTHSYGEPTWSWTEATEGGYTATATFTCTDNDDTQTVNADVTSVTTEATSGTDGSIVYTAKATFNENEYTDTKTVVLPATGLIIGGSEVTDTTAPEATIPEDSTSVEVKNAEQLDDLDSLTVTSKENVVLKFLADALDAIGNAVTGNAQISVESKDTTITGAVVRYDFNVENAEGKKVDFEGSVEVKVPFTPGEGIDGKIYRAWHMKDNDEQEALDTTITGNDTDGWFAHFTMPHFSGAEIAPAAESGYIAGLNSATTEVYTGGDVTVNVAVSSAGEDTHFNAAEVILTYPTDLLTLTAMTQSETFKYTDTNGTVKIEMIGEETAFSTSNFVLNFTAKAEGTATVTLTNAAFAHEDNVHQNTAAGDLRAATISPASVEINIDVETVNVTLPEGDNSVSGETVAKKGEDYTFTVTQDPYYDYEVKATIGEETITLTGTDSNSDGTYDYTISADKVTGNIEITVTPTAKTFSAHISGTDVIEKTETVTYGIAYAFTLPTKAQWQYGYTITIGGASYTGAKMVDNTVTIPGADITGNIEITVTGEQTEFTITHSGSDYTIADENGNGRYEKNEDITITITPADGYDYSVSAVKTGSDPAESVTVSGPTTVDGKLVYTIADISCDLTITVDKTLKGEVKVYTYLTLDADATEGATSKTMFLVTYTGELATDSVPYYGADNTSNPMLWSEKYQAYSWLVIVDNGTLSAEDAAKEVRIASGTKTTVNYGMDINATGKIDAADAQFVYNMYKTMYSSFDEVAMTKFLAADQNGDALTVNGGAITVEDATAIISAILAGTAQ